MLVISEKDQEQLVNMSEVITAVEKALAAFSRGVTVTPVRTSLPFGKDVNSALFMPSVSDELESLGIKVVNVVPGNKAKEKKTINGLVLLFDIETGEPAALLEGSYLTKLRTGALSGAATKYLARTDAGILSVIGTGEQAEALCEAVCTVRKIHTLVLYNRSKGKAEQFAKKMERKLGVRTEVAASGDEAAKRADILVTATTAAEPVYTVKLAKGTHVNAVGSFRPTMQEIPATTVLVAGKVVVESEEAAFEETGDLQQAAEQGFSPDEMLELGKIIDGELAGRSDPEEITLFKSVGLAVADIAVAQYMYAKAIRQQKGTTITL